MRLNRRVPLPPEPKATIRWTEDEWALLAERVWKLRAGHPDWTLTECVRHGQEQLPSERRRKILNAKAFPQLLKLLRDKDADLLGTVAKVSGLEQQAESLRGELGKLRGQHPSREDVLASLPDDEIVKRFARKVLSRLGGIVTAAIVDLLDATPTPTPAPPRERPPITKPLAEMPTPVETSPATVPMNPLANRIKKRVAVYGLQSHQEQIVEKATQDFVKLNFRGKSNGHVPEPGQVDYAVVWTKFTDHSVREILQTRLGRDRVLCHSRGLQSMIALLKNI